jgi:EpsI family protein
MGDRIATGIAWPVVGVFGLVGVATLLFLPELTQLAQLWVSQRGNAHGPLIAAVTLALMWGRRREFAYARAGGALPLLGLALATVAWTAARAASIDVAGWALWPLLVWLAIRLAFGVATARSLRFAIGYFLFSVPLIDLLAPPLQYLTVVVTSVILRVAGLIPVIAGNLVTIPEGTFEIADGCAGTHYLTVALATATLFAYLERLSWRRATLVIAGGVLLALLANWLRVAAIIEIGHLTAMRSGLVRDHYAFGWVIFALTLLPFVVLARIVAGPVMAPLRLASGATAPSTRVVSALGIGTAALAVGPLWAAAIGHVASSQPIPKLSPPAVVGWQGPETSHANWHPAFPGAAIERLATYRAGEARVDAYAAFYSVQARGTKLIGYDSSIAGHGTWREQSRRMRQNPGAVVEVVLIDTAREMRVVWYWFEVRGERLTSATAVKLREALAVIGLAPRSGIVALSARCEPTCENAEAALSEAYRQGLGIWSAGT